MAKNHKKDLVTQVIFGTREYGIGSVLFRHAVGEIIGVNVTDMECLGIIYFKGIVKPSQLSEYTGLSSGATTAMLDRLEKSGLIERRPNPQDRRGTFIVPTRNKTTEKVGALFESVRKAQDTFVSGYSEKELELLADFFSRAVIIWKEEREKLQSGLEKGKKK
jgi:DNA-binding MarR family transcriptional regulator